MFCCLRKSSLRSTHIAISPNTTLNGRRLPTTGDTSHLYVVSIHRVHRMLIRINMSEHWRVSYQEITSNKSCQRQRVPAEVYSCDD